jgi:CHAD domain-containing protein
MDPLWNEADWGRVEHLLASRLKGLAEHRRAALESGDAVAIHKLRVATRKLQASLDLVELPGDPLQVRAIKKDLRRTRRALSRVRNYDVFLAMIEGPGPRLLKRELEARRAEHFDRARPILEGGGLNPLAAQIESVMLAISSGRILRGAIAERSQARLQERLGRLAGLAENVDYPEQVHELRIAIKRLRYLLEALSEIVPANFSSALAWLRSKQDELGHWHDLYLFEEEIIWIASRRKFLRKNLSGAAELLKIALRLRRERKRLSGKLFPVTLPQGVRSLLSGARIRAS